MRRIRQLIGETAIEDLQILTVSCFLLAVAIGGLAAEFELRWLGFFSAVPLVPAVVAGTAWTVRRYREPDRLAIELSWDNRMWIIGLLFVCATPITGVRVMMTGGLSGILVGIPVTVAGLGALALIVRHLRKPVRPPDPIVGKRDPWEVEPPRKGWRLLR
jgi:hypothetical protein